MAILSKAGCPWLSLTNTLVFLLLRDGMIIGRGAIDDKQGVIGISEAIEHLLETGFQPRRYAHLTRLNIQAKTLLVARRTVVVMFGHDEVTVRVAV
jgi:hypothetical protein